MPISMGHGSDTVRGGERSRRGGAARRGQEAHRRCGVIACGHTVVRAVALEVVVVPQVLLAADDAGSRLDLVALGGLAVVVARLVLLATTAPIASLALEGLLEAVVTSGALLGTLVLLVVIRRPVVTRWLVTAALLAGVHP
jgi:hypothetical protein